MRGKRRLLPVILALAVLAGGLPLSGTARADSRTDALRARRAQLVAELAALSPGRDSANAALAAAEAAYNAATAKVQSVEDQITGLNNQLLALSRQIADDEANATAAKKALASVTRATYESSQDDTVMTAVLSANDFNQAMDRISGAAHVTGQIQDLENQLATEEQDLQLKRKQLQTDFAQANALEDQLSAAQNQLLAIVESRNLAASQLTGQARAIAAEIAQIDYELNGGGGSGNYAAPQGGGSCGNHFGYGQCTWYVANRRCIPWGGNADAWYYNAANMGYSEGHNPVPGAVVVWWPNRGGASSVGHVGYVEAVGPNDGIPAGYFKLSEMNWNGWDQVDYRTVANDPGVFQGFIYGHP